MRGIAGLRREAGAYLRQLFGCLPPAASGLRLRGDAAGHTHRYDIQRRGQRRPHGIAASGIVDTPRRRGGRAQEGQHARGEDMLRPHAGAGARVHGGGVEADQKHLLRRACRLRLQDRYGAHYRQLHLQLPSGHACDRRPRQVLPRLDRRILPCRQTQVHGLRLHVQGEHGL